MRRKSSLVLGGLMGFGWVDMGLEEGLVEDDPPYLMGLICEYLRGCRRVRE